jgi:hypothetical protein
MPLLPIIGLLTLGTALTHISLLFPDSVFIANGLGYLVLLAALWRGPGTIPQPDPLGVHRLHPADDRPVGRLRRAEHDRLTQ